MAGHTPESGAFGGSRAVFATTHWSVVLRAGEGHSDDTARALETLCRGYWYPLYAYIRRLGHSPPDAEDLTQSFFAYVLDKSLLSRAEPESGRFRSFLLGSLKNFMANRWRLQQAQKRGRDQTISFDARDAEERYGVEPVDQETPQSIYEKAWAVAVLEQTRVALEAEYAAGDRGALFQRLAPFLQGDRQGATYAEIGASLSMSEGAIKVAVHRLRQRYRELLRASIANTLADPLDVDGELRHLMDVLSR